MPQMSPNSEEKSPIKLLLVGDSGTGKTGSLLSLAEAGYQILLYEFDPQGQQVLSALGSEKALKNIYFQEFSNILTPIGAGKTFKLIPKGEPTAFTNALQQLTHWKTATEDLGKNTTWEKDKIIVIDTLDFMGKAAMWHTLHIDNRSGMPPRIQDYGTAARLLEYTIQLLASSELKCNVIVIAHITYLGGDENTPLIKGYPASVGQKLPQTIGTYFNHTFIAKTIGSGMNIRRKLRLVPDGITEAKSPIQLGQDLPLETGLATYFQAYYKNHPIIGDK